MQHHPSVIKTWHFITSIRRYSVGAVIISTILVSVPAKNVETPIDYIAETAHAEEKPVLIEVSYNWTKERIDQEIDTVAEKYKVSSSTIRKVVYCESRYQIDARGDEGYSRGLVQIHKRYHPHVTDEMADDPKFALDFLAKALKENKGHMWTCFRMI